MRSTSNRGRLLLFIASRDEVTLEEALRCLKLGGDPVWNALNALYHGGLVLLGPPKLGTIMALSALGRKTVQEIEGKRLVGRTAWARLGEL